MGDRQNRLQTGKTSLVDTEYRPVWLGSRRGVFTCVGWQVTLCDPIWQVTIRSCKMKYHYYLLFINSYTNTLPLTFTFT